MPQSKNPFLVILSMLFLGVIVCVIARFSYAAYVIAPVGESLGSVPAKVLLVDVMELDRFALYGAGGGLALGLVLVIVDLLRYGGRGDDLAWKSRLDIDPFAADEVKARRMEVGDRYLKEQVGTGQGDGKG